MRDSWKGEAFIVSEIGGFVGDGMVVRGCLVGWLIDGWIEGVCA